MALTETFKNQAYDAALSSFIQYMNKRRVSLYALLDIKDLISIRSDEDRRDQRHKPLDAVLFSLMREPIDWDRFKEIIVNNINQNIRGMRSHHTPKDEKYDYLVHCVNTLIQSLIERGVHIKGSNSRLPRFEEMGKEIFENAARKIFGNNFKIQTSTQPCFPQNKAEEKFVIEKMQELMSNGYNPQDATTIAIRELEMLRANLQASTNIQLNPYYVNHNSYQDEYIEEYHDDNDWEEEDMYDDEDEDWEE